jgi:hypothetical protein
MIKATTYLPSEPSVLLKYSHPAMWVFKCKIEYTTVVKYSPTKPTARQIRKWVKDTQALHKSPWAGGKLFTNGVWPNKGKPLTTEQLVALDYAALERRVMATCDDTNHPGHAAGSDQLLRLRSMLDYIKYPVKN